LIHEKYVFYTLVSRMGDVFVYRFWRRPLLLVQVNTENSRVMIFHLFTHPITDSNAISLTVCFFSFLPQIWMIQNNIWWSSNKFSNLRLLVFADKWEVCAILPDFHDLNYLNHGTIHIWQDWNTRSNSRNSLKYMMFINCNGPLNI
jgi:hypothetical protein